LHLSRSEAESETNARSAALAAIRSDPGGGLWQRALNGLWLWLNLQWAPAVVHGRPLIVLAGPGGTVVDPLLPLYRRGRGGWRGRRRSGAAPIHRAAAGSS